ncbi:hypothetical protein FE257_012329 [Aspergillus nanangensis]|uniref:Uncharacterized protein n=1 Tax=Aspergillus nanangensis TaxID=2582783 RepID=A0AAD4CHP8_ASPNN|nr:hypothetical protein FE257_012329 [Aspergillus nanangensis]
MRPHLSTIISSLLAGSLLHHVVVSIPLTASDHQVRAVDLSLENIRSSLTVSGVPIAAEFAKRDDKKLMTWNEAVARGRRNIEKLENPEVPDDDDCEETIPSYTVHYEPGNSDNTVRNFYTQELQVFKRNAWPMEFLNTFGVEDDEGKLPVISIFSKQHRKTRFQAKPVSQNGFMVDRGVMLALSNSVKEDTNPADDRMPPTEIAMQVWDQVAGLRKDQLSSTGSFAPKL